MHGQTAPQICMGKWMYAAQGMWGLWKCATQIYCRDHGGFTVQVAIPLDHHHAQNKAMLHSDCSKTMTEHSRNASTDPFL